MRGAFWIGVSEFWVGEKRLQRAVARELSAPNHFHFRGGERQEQNVLEIIIIVCFAHGREIDHSRQALLQFVSVAMQSDER